MLQIYCIIFCGDSELLYSYYRMDKNWDQPDLGGDTVTTESYAYYVDPEMLIT